MIKRVSIVTLLVAAVVSATALAARGGANATATEAAPLGAVGTEATSPGERFSSYRAPTGPEMSSLSAAAVALNELQIEEKQRGLAAGKEVTMTVGHGTFAEAKAVLEGKSAGAAETGSTVGCLNGQSEVARCPTPAETVERRRSGAYVVVMKGREFAPTVPVPRGRSGPSGNVRALVLNSTTGFVEEEYVGSSSPQINTLGAVTSFGSALVADVAATGQAGRSERLNRHLGYLAGRVFDGKTPAGGWLVQIAHRGGSRPLQARRTFADGRFIFNPRAGDYVLAAQGPDGRPCRSLHKRVAALEVASAVIVCH